MDEVLLDIGVGARHIGLGLVVVVIRDEILDRVVGKKILELAIELRGQRLVRRQDQGRALRCLDHLRHGVGFSRPGDAEQHLGAVVAGDAFDQIRNRGRLIALRLVVGFDHEAHAAFGFFRAGRAMRRPDFQLAVFAFELGAALSDQIFQRVGGGLDAERFHLAARRAGERLIVILGGRQAKLPRQLGIERRDRRGGAVVRSLEFALGRFVKTSCFHPFCVAPGDIVARSLRRGARAMCGGFAAGAAIPGIIRRRLQSGRGTDAALAAVDRGIEQFCERRSDRLHLGASGLGTWRFRFRGFAGLFGIV